jgi:hypothetical protein
VRSSAGMGPPPPGSDVSSSSLRAVCAFSFISAFRGKGVHIMEHQLSSR